MEPRDLVIIGGGPAGYVAAIRARQLGASVLLVEADELGGTCLNRGCIPTRALVRAAELLDSPKKAREYGIAFGQAEVSLAQMMARKDTVAKMVGGGVRLLMESYGVRVVRARGRLLSPAEVELAPADGKVERVEARRLLLATGAEWARPDIPGAEMLVTSDEALSLQSVPASLVVIGGGAVAMTFATIFSRLGSRVTVVTAGPRVLPEIDGEIVSLLERELRRQKIQVITGAEPVRLEGGPGALTLMVQAADGVTPLTAETVLYLDQRRAHTGGLGLEEAGVSAAPGGITVNRAMQTSAPGVWAAGDVVGEPYLAHVAFAEGRVAAENALGREVEMDYRAVPRCVCTVPEVASVGLTEEEAKAQGDEIQVGRFPLAANGLASALGERSGLVKVVSEAHYGQVLGVHIMGPGASELIGAASLAVRMEATAADVAGALWAHPTISEALMEASLAVSGEAIHMPGGGR